MGADKANLAADKSGEPREHRVENESLLDFAVRKALDPALKVVHSSSSVQESVESMAHDFVKIAPLFMHGKLAVAGAIATYAADEVKRSDKGSEILVDAVLGAGKAAALVSTQRFLGSRNTTPSLMGVEMGIVSRASDTGLTRQNYYDKNGHFSLSTGLEKTAKAATESIGTDATTFLVADKVWGRMNILTRGQMTFSPMLQGAVTATTFNVTSAAGSEITRQVDAGKFDAGAFLNQTVKAGAVGLAAGALGGLQGRRFLATDIKDSPTSMQEALSTPFQKGDIVDSAQKVLRDGEFHSSKRIEVPTGVSYVGITKSEGSLWTPTIFRVTDGELLAVKRQQAEIGAYGLNSKLQLPGVEYPTSVAKVVEIDGQPVSGFVQEMKGDNLFEHFREKFNLSEGKRPVKSDVLQHIEGDADLRRKLVSAWTERLIYGEWDNHSMNTVVDGKGADLKVKNIDLGDAFPAADTSLHYTPHPGLRRSHEFMNSYLYRRLAQEKFTPELTQSLKAFVDKHDNPAGRKEIQELGFTPQQTDGIIGRAKWFAEHQKLPEGNQAFTDEFSRKPTKFIYRRLRNSPAVSWLRDVKHSVQLNSLPDQPEH